MKILLINSTWPSFSSLDYEINVYTPEISTVWPPLGLGYIASELLRQGHDVIIYDKNAKFAFYKDIRQVNLKLMDQIKIFQPDIVGISATTPLIQDAFSSAELVKKYNHNIKVILGGVHGTALPRETLKSCTNIDIIIRGEGELTFAELCIEYNLEKVQGIAYRNSYGEIILTGNRTINMNIDSILYPARQLFDMPFYLQPSTQIIFGYNCSATSIISSRGCPNACSFCAGPIMSQNKVRLHSVDYTITEIEMLIKNYGVSGLFFVDEMFTANKERVLSLCHKMIKKGINTQLVWGAQLRVDYIDYEMLMIMKEAGCVQVEYGFESGSSSILKEMNKNITVERCIEASNITKKAGIRQLANIIVGWPTERLEDLKKTVQLVKQTKPDFVSWHEFKPLPGAKAWKYAKENHIEEESFEKNKPFIFCNVLENERKRMVELYMNASMERNLNNADGLHVEKTLLS